MKLFIACVLTASVWLGCSPVAVEHSRNVDFDFSKIKILYMPPAPPYPPEAKAAHVDGTVVVEITMGPDGIPISAHALSGPMELRKATEEFAMGWRFGPAMLDGVAMTARFKLTCPWRLKK